jgi:hypothetical protein
VIARRGWCVARLDHLVDDHHQNAGKSDDYRPDCYFNVGLDHEPIGSMRLFERTHQLPPARCHAAHASAGGTPELPVGLGPLQYDLLSLLSQGFAAMMGLFLRRGKRI